MSDFPITPQQDYLTIASTTGKGFKQSILKSEIQLQGLAPLAPAGAAVTGLAVSNNDLSFDGSLFTFAREGVFESFCTFTWSGTVAPGKYLLAIRVTNLGYSYEYLYDLTNQQNQATLHFTRKVVPGDFTQWYIAPGDSGVTGITPIYCTARLY
jgi:hypothetical protein